MSLKFCVYMAKMKKELEDQLKIQQELHKEYGEVIKQLTDDLEGEQNKNEELIKKQGEFKSKIESLESDIKDLEKTISTKTKEDNASQTSFYDSFSQNEKTDDSNTQENSKTCPNCGAQINEGYLFCESCGTKL